MRSEADGTSVFIKNHLEDQFSRSKCCNGAVRMKYAVFDSGYDGELEVFACLCVFFCT